MPKQTFVVARGPLFGRPTLKRTAGCSLFVLLSSVNLAAMAFPHFRNWQLIGMYAQMAMPLAGLCVTLLARAGVNRRLLLLGMRTYLYGTAAVWPYCLAMAASGSPIGSAGAALAGVAGLHLVRPAISKRYRRWAASAPR